MQICCRIFSHGQPDWLPDYNQPNGAQHPTLHKQMGKVIYLQYKQTQTIMTTLIETAEIINTETRAVRAVAYHPTKIWNFICQMYGGDTLRHYVTREDYEGLADTISRDFYLTPEQWEAVLENFELTASTLINMR